MGDVGGIHRFASRGHFASWNGTAPLDASSGDQQRHRLSRAGNRRINRVLHLMAVVQLRHDTPGRAHYRRRLAEGKTPMEAIRPGGQTGATLQSSAADPNPQVSTSEQSLPGPAGPHPRTQHPDAA
jgi:hypothetical protein